jgi:hypothetical protein
LWEEKFEEPFDLDESDDNYKIDIEFKSQISYDLVAASNRQKSFYYNVSLPHFRSKIYLNLCLERYKKLLFLKKKSPKLVIVPCYGIDIIWHTHQLHPLAYANDTMNYLGYMLRHDDTLDDRTPGSDLSKSLKKTKTAWLRTFNEKFDFPGGMYRGEAPSFCSDFSKKKTDLSQFYPMKNRGVFTLKEAV